MFSFSLKNGPSAQAAPPVAVKVLYGTDSEKNTDQQMMTGPADTALHALNILPETQILDTYKIGQLEAAQGGLNALCVTLTANKALTSETSSTGGNRFVAFTIRGLTGFATDTQTLSVLGTDGMTAIANTNSAHEFFQKDEGQNSAENQLHYDSDKGEVTFFLKDSKTMAKDTDYSFCFQLTNPKMEMPCRDVTIAAKDKDMATSEAITFKMTQDSGMLANYAKGSKCAGYTAPRAFTTATLRLNSAVVGYEATAIVELVTNYKIDTQKVITISGLSGFKALSQGSGAETSDVDFVTFTENGMHAIDLGKKGTWDGVSTLTITTGTAADSDANNDGDVIDTTAPADVNGNLLRAWGALDSGSPLTAGAGTKTGAYMYELVFKMKNPASAQAAPAVSIAADDGFAAAAVDTGKAAAARRSGLALMSQRRAGSGAMTFTYKAVTALYGGESLVLDLPHYKGTDGAVFGVTSSPSDAFTTYENSNEWIANGVAEKKARAMFSQGFVATGSDHSATAGVNGILLLDSDDDGYNENKKNWFAEGSICDTKATQETTEGDATTAYTGIQNLYTLAGCSKAVAGYKADAFAGTVLTCNKGDYSLSRYVLSTKFNANVLQVVVDQDFPDATKDLEDDDNKKVWSACSLSYKSTVGKYTGHKVMMEDGEEYTIKQGAGPFYQVSDGSGTDVVSATLDGKKYTVYSQLVLTAKNGATIAEGEEVTITIPAGVLTAPADLSAPVNEEDDDKATIAEKTTIRHMLVAPMVHAPAIAAAKSKFVLSKTWPYGTTSESESHLKGKMVELFGAASLLAAGTTGAALDDTKYKFEKVSSSVLSKKDALSHTASDEALTATLKGTGASALIAGVTSDVFWTAHADVEIDTTTGAITVDRATANTPITRTLTEPLNPPAFDASKAADDYLSSSAFLIDSIGQFLGNDPAVNGADTATDIVGLGTFVPQPISEFTAAVADASLATLAVKDTNADTDRAKAFSSSIRAAITLVPEQMMAFAASGDCSAGPTEVRIAQGVKTCGSDLGAGSAGSLADRYPCGVKVVLEGAAADGPSLALPADMPAGACVSVKVLTAEDVEFPAEEAYNANAGVDALKKFKWGKKWMVVTQILGLDVTGLTSAVNVTSGAIVAMDGPPSRRRLLAACPEGYEYRMGAVGTTFADTCACPSACGEATASCAVTASGNWTAILVPASVCAETSADNTGAIVGGVVGGLLGLLLLAAIAYYCCRQQEQGPTGRAVAQEKPMVPVYLPQAYPVIPAEYAPAAAPMPVMPMEYVQQPMAVSVQPMMVEQQQQPVAYGM